MTGGDYYSAESAGELQAVFENLPTYLITKHEVLEISVVFVALGALSGRSAAPRTRLASATLTSRPGPPRRRTKDRTGERSGQTGDDRPADDRAADAAPPPVRLVDVAGQLRLLG